MTEPEHTGFCFMGNGFFRNKILEKKEIFYESDNCYDERLTDKKKEEMTDK